MVMLGNALSKALWSIAALPISVSTDSSLGMAILIRVTLRKSRLRRSIQLVVYIIACSSGALFRYVMYAL